MAAVISGASAQSISDLQQMSIAQLETVDVTSVTRSGEPLAETPAALSVITQDVIVRSGAVSLPEVLRLAPNLQVSQTGASRYTITARGFSGNIPDQSFSNQLLVMIDGRSVYSPLYSGVYWDMQDLPVENIERIEVISGPGATMWGANAVNGVINVTTKSAAETQGLLVSVSGGNLQQTATVQYGGRIGQDVAFRAYVREFANGNSESMTRPSAHDHWSKPQAGFRMDWAAGSSDTVTLQGDGYQGWDSQAAAPSETIAGGNVVARWNHRGEGGSALQVQAYYDHASRATPGSGDFWVDTVDLDLQHSIPLGAHAIIWGGGGRISTYRINGTGSIYFVPPSRSLGLFDVFAQDSFSLTSALTAIAGVKLEADPWSALAVLPSLRLAWKVDDDTLLWVAASRAVRAPTPFDTDVAERVGDLVALNGNPQFHPVTLDAYEAGLRTHFGNLFRATISAFYNVYHDVRTVDLTGGPATLNLAWGNKLGGHTSGFEFWGSYQVTAWWRLTATFDLLAESFRFNRGAVPLLGASQIGDDPANTASLRSHFELTPDIGFDTNLRYVSRLPQPQVPAYMELNANLSWRLSDTLQLSLSGFNLLHARHLEFPLPEATAVPRSFSVGLRWRT